MTTETVIDLNPLAIHDPEAVPVYIEPEATAKIELAMAGAAKMVEDAFAVAEARAIGAMMDALLAEAVAVGDPEGVPRAKRAMVSALERLKKGRDALDHVDERTKFYSATPIPSNRKESK